MQTTDVIFSYNLKRLRKAKKLNQAELAEAAGLSLRSYQEIEYGNSYPRPANLEALAKALEVSVVDLFVDPTVAPKTKLVSEMTESEFKETLLTAAPIEAADELKFLKAQFDKVFDQLIQTRTDLESERKVSAQLRSRLSKLTEEKEQLKPLELSPEAKSSLIGIVGRLSSLNKDQLSTVSGFIEDLVEFSSSDESTPSLKIR